MEKAHPDVLELFYQVFDKGVLEDAEGREVDFKNALILLTSNAASTTIMRLCTTPETCPAPEALVEALRPELLKVFKPALLGRMIIVPYYPITDNVMQQIIALQLARIRTRLLAHTRAQFSYDQALITSIANRCTDVASGARMVDHILTRTLLPAISRALLTRMADGETITKVHVVVGADGGLQYEIAPLPPNAVVEP
jgi:type VI secretion system protein VasG